MVGVCLYDRGELARDGREQVYTGNLGLEQLSEKSGEV